ncbi:MAG TPA: TetR/AcrR family transcriptional regulator [Ktedonobacteraceae bacterium]|nr:TetR/AcrR family transcriptional regulator [Ktedonobacteraceae bacterium]
MHDVTPQHRSLKEKQRQERENLILQAAEEVLLEKGYHETSMDEIAARVGIAKGTLYLHFARKEDLVIALLERELHTVLLMVEHANRMGGSAQEKLAFIFNSLYQELFGKRAQLIYVLYNSIELKSVLLKYMVKEKQGDTLNRIAASVAALLEEGKAAGMFDPTLPTAVMLNLFFSVLSPRAYKNLVLDQKMSLDELVRCMERIYFRGIAAPEPAKNY